jgi:hypothetical protein
MRRFTLGVLLCALVAAWPAAAQEQRATLEGVVTDSSGGVLPGAAVEARNTQRGIAVTAVSDSAGVYRFPSLPPGLYDVTVTLQGFSPGRAERVELLLGQIKTVNFTLAVGAVTETVAVTAESPLVDVKQSMRATSIRDEQVELLPKGRDFTTLVTQATGANFEVRSGGISIDGSSASENRFIIDGIETTDLQTGVSGQSLIADFVEEVQVKSSGYTAEYGGATGGVINVITKSGTNQYHGSGLFYLQGSAFESGRYDLSEFGGSTGAAPRAAGGRDTLRLNPLTNALQYIRYPEDDSYRFEPGFSTGGPLARDKAWFYGAYQPSLIRYERTVEQLSGGTVTEDQTDRRHYFTVNQTAQLGNDLRTRVAFNNSWRRRDGLLPSLDGTDPAGTSYAPTRTWPVWTVSGQADWTARQDLYFGFRAGYYHSNVYDDNITEEPRFFFTPNGNIGLAGVPASLQRGAGFNSIPTNFKIEKDIQTRLYYQADATWYGNFGGQHTFKGGVQVDHLGNEVLSGESRNLVRIRWGLALGGRRGPFGYYQVRSNGVDPKKGFITEGDVSSTNVGLFIQDAWTIKERLTVNLGVRTERERVPAYAVGSDIPEFGVAFDFQDKFAPRIGAAYDLTGDGRWKAYGSWGIFYDIFKLELPRGSFGGDKWLEYYYSLDTPDWTTLVSNANCPPACSGTLIRGPIDFRHPSFGSDAIDPDLSPMQLRESAVGLERQLGRVMAVSARWVRKRVERAIEDTGALDPQGNEIYIIANPGEGLTRFAHPGVPLPRAKRDYDAVEFTFDKRYSDNWFLHAGYTWSRLVGNFTGLSQSDENGRTSPNVGRMFDYPAMMFDGRGVPIDGPLPTDRPHQFKAQAIYVLPFGTSVGLNQYISSGVPVTREIGIYPPNNLPVQYRGRLSDGRTDVLSQTDVYLQHEFRLTGGRALQVSLNVVNLFDQSAAIGRWQTYQLSDGINLPDEDLFYSGRLDFDQLIQQQRVVQDPRFLQDSFFQTPISARIGVKFLF